MSLQTSLRFFRSLLLKTLLSVPVRVRPCLYVHTHLTREGRILTGTTLIIFLLSCSLIASAQTTHTYQRAISLAPSITECIFAIGASNHLVGVGDFDNYPPATAKLPRCGGWNNPNFESIRSLNPDLIFILGQHQKIREFAAVRGIHVESIEVETLDDIPKCYQKLGRLLGAEAGATSATQAFERELEPYEKDLAAHPDRHKPRVFLCLSRQEGSLANLVTVPPWSFLAKALELAGGENIFADLKQYYPSISKEALLARKPEVIIELREGPPLAPPQEQAALQQWQKIEGLPAVRDKRVFLLSAPGALIPGPRFPQTIRRMHELLWSHSD